VKLPVSHSHCCVVSAGGRRYLYPKDVWSPAGGWWNNEPLNWQRNTGFAFLAAGVAAYTIFQFSAAREVRVSVLGVRVLVSACCICRRYCLLLQRRPTPPVNFIASQIWSAHAAEDDPRLAPVVDEYAEPAGSPPLGQR
jgi:hypothetical protein